MENTHFIERILIVEDGWDLNRAVGYALQREGFEVCRAHSINEAKGLFRKAEFKLILLDVNLPDGEGFEFCEWAREKRSVPVLFLTARDLEEDVLKGYELGAQDYVTKPFSMKVLMKKIRVILGRLEKEESPGFDDGYLRVDFYRARVETGGKECLLTPTEYRMLKEFLMHKGQLLTYDVLLERLWDSGGQFVDRHTLAVNVNRLRGKIEDEKHRYISNVYGMGYQWLDS